MEVIRSFETSVDIRTTRRYFPEDGSMDYSNFTKSTGYAVFFSCLLLQFSKALPPVGSWRWPQDTPVSLALCFTYGLGCHYLFLFDRFLKPCSVYWSALCRLVICFLAAALPRQWSVLILLLPIIIIYLFELQMGVYPVAVVVQWDTTHK
jgi:hypothetical protein